MATGCKIERVLQRTFYVVTHTYGCAVDTFKKNILAFGLNIGIKKRKKN
jgi:hypothetical protein